MVTMYKRDSTTTRFTKGIRLTEEDWLYIFQTKGKKSLAGRLEEIIKLIKEYGENKI